MLKPIKMKEPTKSPFKLSLLTTVIVIALLGCNSSTRLKLMKSGKVASKHFYETLSFDYGGKIMIIEAQFNGQKGRFLFDTGAPNVISHEFADRLKLEALAKGQVNDAGGNTLKNQSFVKIDDITISGVSFKNTGAVVQNLSGSAVMRCLAIDGIVGANLMRQAHWKIDYQKQEITFTDDINQLGINDDYTAIDFDTKAQGTPVIKANVDGVSVYNITWDTGSNGEISLPTKAFKLLKTLKTVEYEYAVGATSYGVGGKAKSDTAFFTNIQNTKMGSTALEGKVIEFSSYSRNIGNKFFENYQTVLDWDQKKIHLLKVEEYNFDTLSTFGFGIDWQDGGLHVGTIYSHTDAAQHLKNGDKIIEINSENIESLTHEVLCEKFKKNKLGNHEGEQLTIKVRRAQEELEFVLEKKHLLAPLN